MGPRGIFAQQFKFHLLGQKIDQLPILEIAIKGEADELAPNYLHHWYRDEEIRICFNFYPSFGSEGWQRIKVNG